MATELEKALAMALAAAVKQQSCMFEWSKKFSGDRYPLPDWYQPAVDALELYEDQREQELLDGNRIY